MSERWDEISSLSSLRIFVGMLFGQARNNDWNFILLVGDKKNDLEELYSMYSEKCLCG